MLDHDLVNFCFDAYKTKLETNDFYFVWLGKKIPKTQLRTYIKTKGIKKKEKTLKRLHSKLIFL